MQPNSKAVVSSVAPPTVKPANRTSSPTCSSAPAIEDLPDVVPTRSVPDAAELAAVGLVPVSAFVFSRSAQERSKDAARMAAKREKNKKQGIRQFSADAPGQLHLALRAFIRQMAVSGDVRDAVLALLHALPLGETINPADLRDLEAALTAEPIRPNGPRPH